VSLLMSILGTSGESDRMEGLVGLEISGVLAEGEVDGAALGGTAP
jgi:hypothetical protein